MAKNHSPNWNRINAKLDSFYSGHLNPSTLEAAGFELKTSSGSWTSKSGAPLTYQGQFYLYHSVSKLTGNSILLERLAGQTVKSIHPRDFVKEFGCYSGMGKKEANAAMYREVLTDKELEDELGWKTFKSKLITKDNMGNYKKLIGNAKMEHKATTYRPHANDPLYVNLKQKGLEAKWPLVNSLINRFYSSVVYQFLSSECALKESLNENIQVFYTQKGIAIEFHAIPRDGGFCIYNKSTGQAFTPLSFMLENGPLSKVSNKSVFEHIYRESIPVDDYQHIFEVVIRAPKLSKSELELIKKSKSNKIKYTLEDIAKSKMSVQRMFGRGVLGDGGILVDRGVPESLLIEDPRFNKKFVFCTENWSIKDSDEKKKIEYVAFIHKNTKGEIVGGERFLAKNKKGKNVKLFTKNPSQKLLWMSDEIEKADVIVLGENVLDMLSHAALFPKSSYGYMATSGNIGHQAMSFLKYQLNRLSEGRERPITIVLAFDNDSQKKIDAASVFREQFIEALSPVYSTVDKFDQLDRKGLCISILPPDSLNDWNDALVKQNQLRAEQVEALKLHSEVKINNNTADGFNADLLSNELKSNIKEERTAQPRCTNSYEIR